MSTSNALRTALTKAEEDLDAVFFRRFLVAFFIFLGL